jgi:quercetin dioxygenase-like cupin family protein
MPMRLKFALGAAIAVPALAAAPVIAPPLFDVRVPVPRENGPQDVQMLQRTFPVGGSSGWHVHPGTEIAYLVSGEMLLRRAGAPPRLMKPGQHFIMPRGVAHTGINVGTEPAVVVVTYLVDRNAPVRTDAAVPAGN